MSMQSEWVGFGVRRVVPKIEAKPVPVEVIEKKPIDEEPEERIREGVWVADVVDFAAKQFGVTVTELVSPRRNAQIAHVRQIAMWLARECTSRSYPYIGKRLGGRDHTTVMHGCRKIDNLRRDNADFRRETDGLRDTLRARSERTA